MLRRPRPKRLVNPTLYTRLHLGVRWNQPSAPPFATPVSPPDYSRSSSGPPRCSAPHLRLPAIPARRRSTLRQPPLATQIPKTVSYLWLVLQPEFETP